MLRSLLDGNGRNLLAADCSSPAVFVSVPLGTGVLAAGVAGSSSFPASSSLSPSSLQIIIYLNVTDRGFESTCEILSKVITIGTALCYSTVEDYFLCPTRTEVVKFRILSSWLMSNQSLITKPLPEMVFLTVHIDLTNTCSLVGCFDTSSGGWPKRWWENVLQFTSDRHDLSDFS